MRTTKSKKAYRFIPEFRPVNIQVILDEGIERMEGNLIILSIIDVRYDADFMRITVEDHRPKK